MDKLTTKGKESLKILIAILGQQDSILLKEEGSFPLRVELTEYFAGHPIYEVAEYGNEQHCSMRVPQMEFLEKDGDFYPISYRDDYNMTYKHPVELGESKKTGKPYVYVSDLPTQKKLADYASSWLQVIASTTASIPQQIAA